MNALEASDGDLPRSSAMNTGPLPWLAWKFSLLLPFALVALAATIVFNLVAGDPDTIAFRVIDEESGNPVVGAEVRFGTTSFTTNDDGVAQIPSSDRSQDFRVDSEGFAPITGSIGADSANKQQVRLPKETFSETIPAAQDTQLIANNVVPTELPSGALASAAGTATSDQVVTPAQEPTATATVPARTAIEGVVTSDAGKPIQGARITDGTQLQVTGKDGIFTLDATKIDPAATIRISASGYADGFFPVADTNEPIELALKLRPIKAIYMNPNITETKADIDRLIEIIDTTDANAIVIDIKEELVFYDTQVEFFREAGTVAPVLDLPALLEKLHDHGIYTIARLVVFKDSLVAEEHPDLAVINNQTGDLWRDMNGVAWVNPMVHDLWEVNTDLALEAATLGFDEIQYDYIRFPTDGDLSTTDFGLPNTQESRERAITKFLEMSRKKLLPTGAKVSADVFGYTLLVDDDLGIGQNFIKMADYVDYLSPMVYPSHFPNGSIAVDGHPNDFPYETIDVSMRAGKRKLGGSALQIRPWLQDFSFFDLMPYGDAEVRAQIEAAEKVGTSGWMLWDPNNQFHPKAFPETGRDRSRAPEPGSTTTPVAIGINGLRPVTRSRVRARRR